jgi:nicotinate-nucleotide adenylyltransferase
VNLSSRPAFVRLPRHEAGNRIGLLGGTFNPAHAGHRLLSLIALRRLRLDAVWWLVTPGNPLKDARALPPLAERMAQARIVAAHPRIVVTGIEAEIGKRYTYDALAFLLRRAPAVRFVWLMGADNLRQFDRWRRWRDIAARAPIAVIDRPGSSLKAMRSKAGLWLAPRRLPERAAARLATTPPPAFIFLHGPRSGLSSTALRRAAIEKVDKSRHVATTPPAGAAI